MSILIGVPLSTYKEKLHHVPDGVLPSRTIKDYLARLAPFHAEMEYIARQYDVFDPFAHCSRLPQEFYSSCTFEELCKIYGSSIFQLARPQYEIFEKESAYAIVRKIKSSLWRWGSGSTEDEWNTLVDAYDGIRNFSFGLPEFEVSLIYTTGYNECGSSEHDRKIFLDGVFGFMVYYRGLHVMTIGFSIARGGKLLLTQVQMKKEKGNRFLYKLPMPYVEYAIMLMEKFFPKLALYLVDGDSIVEKYLPQYETSLNFLLESVKRNEESIAELLRVNADATGENAHLQQSLAYCLKRREELPKDIELTRTCITGLKGATGDRVRKTYLLKSGPWRLSHQDTVEMNRLRFSRIVRA